jgi:acyl-CoA synthetase (AMP-forming)/AMP-acid ligase II
MLKDSQATTLITTTKELTKIQDIIHHSPYLKTLILIDNNHTKENPKTEMINNSTLKVLDYTQIINTYSPIGPLTKNIDTDIASIIYTSGSTNFSKGVLLTHLNMVTAAESIVNYIHNTCDDIILTCLPFAFDYSLYQMLTAFYVGGKVIVHQNFIYPAYIMDTIVKEKVTGFAIVPTIIALFKEHNYIQHNEIPHLRYICSSAQALPISSIEYIQKTLFPNVEIYSMYGLTECKSVSGLDPKDIEKKPNSVGKALSNMEVYVVDAAGKKHSMNATGELVVRGSHVMKGYLNNPEETKKKLKPGSIPGESHLYTGDLFKIDAEGYLYYIGRIDNMINAAGIQISPKEIEDVIYELDDVIEAAVLGVPHHIYGEAIKAVVAADEGSSLTEKMIENHCRRKLERNSIPHIYEIRSSLPKTANGKIDKKALIN